MKQQNKRSRKNTSGFTLVELTVAMFVLTVGVLGGMIMIVLGMTWDNTNRMDTTATNAAQAVLAEKIDRSVDQARFRIRLQHWNRSSSGSEPT